jgi:glycolate oxidase FAD binding subunit
MLKQKTLLSELRSIAGKKHAREPRDGPDCAVDGLPPRAVVEPGTCEEVAEVLRFANTERLAVIPRGGGHQIQLGNLPSRYDIALSLARLDQLTEHEPADLTVTCQSGIPVGKLGNLLAQANQMVPLALYPDPADPLTVGGLLALNMGDSPAAYGTPRDFTIGLKVVTADGRVSKTGGKVVKNVAGYDLCKLYIGSRGTLAVIVEATFKLFPRPQVTETVSFEFEDCADACRTARGTQAMGLGLIDARLIPAALAHADRSGPHYHVLHLAFAGKPGTIERSRSEFQKLAAESRGQDIAWPGRGAKPATPDGMRYAEHPLSVRAHLPPTRVADFIQAMGSGTDGVFDAAPVVGNVTWVWAFECDQVARIEAARTAATRLGGTLEVQSCSPKLKREIDVLGPPPPSFPLMRAIKREFDPNNVLSPGRFVGRL